MVFLFILLFFNGFVFAQSQKNILSIEKYPTWLIGIKFSTFGIGVEGHVILSNKFHLRSGISYFNINYPLEKVRQGLNGKINFSPSGIMLIFDYWLHKKVFLTAGTFLNFTEISITGELSESVLIGDIEMRPEEVGYINADLTPGYFISPYLGVGFGQSITQLKKMSFAFEIGILFHGRPQVSLDATGMLTPTASTAQETLIEENIAPLSLYPIVSISLYYNFLPNK